MKKLTLNQMEKVEGGDFSVEKCLVGAGTTLAANAGWISALTTIGWGWAALIAVASVGCVVGGNG
jgi:hypothetical protein